jgi:GR25 family glycosyltransferase involved in LPS biosynthesis
MDSINIKLVNLKQQYKNNIRTFYPISYKYSQIDESNENIIESVVHNELSSFYEINDFDKKYESDQSVDKFKEIKDEYVNPTKSISNQVLSGFQDCLIKITSKKKVIIQFKLNGKFIKNLRITNKNYTYTIDIVPYKGILVNCEIDKDSIFEIEFSIIDLCSRVNIWDFETFRVNNYIKIEWDKMYIINLEKRPTRKIDMIKKLENENIKNYEIIKAIDGKNPLTMNEFMQLKKENATNIPTEGHYGCLLSHLDIIKKARYNKLKYVLILEDDVIFENNFLNKLENILVPEFDLLYIGGLIMQEKVFFNEWAFHKSIMGAYAYILPNHMYDVVIEELETMNQCIDICFIQKIQSKYTAILLNDLIKTNIDTSDTSAKNNNMKIMLNNTTNNNIKREFSKYIFNKINYVDHIVWINMDRSVDRRELMNELFQNITIPSTRITAIDGKNDDITKYTLNFKKKLSTYEIACTLSHIKAISYLSELPGKYFLVCEDDISFENLKFFNYNIEHIVTEFKKQKEDNFDILLLQKIYKKKITKNFVDWNRKIYGSACYIISAEGIDKITKFAQYDRYSDSFIINKRLRVADTYIFKYVDTYVYKYNFITTVDNYSEIHNEHLEMHKECNKVQLNVILENIN